jgi:ABC-2 type transport system ATP-binding protein
MTAVLEISDIHKTFGDHKVLDGFSLRVEEGEIWGLLGPNGCGKSTALNIICHLISSDSGAVRLMGKPMHELSLQARSLIGFCTQRCALYPDLTPAENLHFFGQLYGFSDKACQQRVAELMLDFALHDFSHTRAGQLSGGWQQRLHLAVSLIHRPKLLVLDEPTAAVDVEARMHIWRIIEKLRNEGTTILMTSHHLAEAERLCNKVALMRNGKVEVQGSISALLARVPGQAVARVQTTEYDNIKQRAALAGWPVRQHADDLKLFVPANLSLRDILDALDGTQLTSISLHPVTLDDAYLELLSEVPFMASAHHL